MSINKNQEQLFEVLSDEASENLTGGEQLYAESKDIQPTYITDEPPSFNEMFGNTLKSFPKFLRNIVKPMLLAQYNSMFG